MKKFIRRTAKLFILIAGMFLNAHMIIPHDHHGAVQIRGHENSCPASDHKSELPFIPVHCNAFNDLTADKFHTDLIKKSVLTGSIFVMNISDSDLPDYRGTYSIITDYGQSSYLDISCSSVLLRAPPSVA